MTQKIANHLKKNPSYLKWGKERLAKRFGCSVKTMTNIVESLSKVKARYLKQFEN